MTSIFSVEPQHKYTDCVEKVIKYIGEHLSDSNLSLKWISENYLFMNPDYVAKAKELYGITGSQIAALNWGNFFTVNLLPVTIGNIIGGGFIIGGLFFYLHGKNCK